MRAIYADIVCSRRCCGGPACGAAVVARNQEAVVPSGGPAAVDWPVYRSNPKGNQYSALAQIHAGNVHQLERAWEYKTGDANQRSTMHVNPIVVNGVMYVTTASLKAVALNAATGREIWSFDRARHNNGNVVRLRNRGWCIGKPRGRAHLPLRARSGLRGRREDGRVDLGVRQQRLHRPQAEPRRRPGLGGDRDDFARGGVQERPDHRVARQRELRRLARPHPWLRCRHRRPQVDVPHHPARGTGRPRLLEVGQGRELRRRQRLGRRDHRRAARLGIRRYRSATEDFYGGFRKGDNLFANSVLALDAITGERKWHYQTVRHDIWDYDNPPAPILVTIGSDRPRKMPSCSSPRWASRSCSIATREAALPRTGVPVPRSTVPGEETAPTQIVPLKPQPLVRQTLTEADLTNITPEARAQALRDFRRYLSDRSIPRRACRARSPRPDISAARNGTAPASIRC